MLRPLLSRIVIKKGTDSLRDYPRHGIGESPGGQGHRTGRYPVVRTAYAPIGADVDLFQRFPQPADLFAGTQIKTDYDVAVLQVMDQPLVWDT